jgi:hypothetical protein
MLRRPAVSWFVAVSLAACASDDDGGDGGDDGGGDVECAAFSACGGDPVGEWAFVDACVDEAVYSLDIPGCPDATNELVESEVSGTLSIAVDGTYVVDQALMTRSILRFPLSCIEGDADSCEEAGEPLESECTASGSDCACEQAAEATAGENGTWEVDGTDITFAAAGGAGATGQFCVDGDRLELRQPQTVADVMSSLILERL